MGVDLSDTSEVVTIRIQTPSDIPAVEGRTFTTPWFNVDRERSDLFEFATYLDSYPNPYEQEPGDGYGEGLIEGFHLVGMIDYLLNHVIVPEFRCVPWNYGLDHVRFVSVVRVTDRWRISGRVREVHDRGTQGSLVVIDLTAEVEGRTKPAFVATQRFLWVTDASAGPAADQIRTFSDQN
jgi:acyl dehydratase